MRQKSSGIFVLACLLGLLAEALVPVAAATPPPECQGHKSDYIIGPGDQLNVFVWQNPDLSISVQVRPDGRISTPLNEDMVAVGRTPCQLSKDIQQQLSEYVRAPHVNVIVTRAASIFSQVKVIGQVKTPEAIPYRAGMKVLDAVLAVGGLTEYAAGNRARIVRTVDGKEQDIPVSLSDLLNDGDLAQNRPLKPGDVLVVPESRF